MTLIKNIKALQKLAELQEAYQRASQNVDTARGITIAIDQSLAELKEDPSSNQEFIAVKKKSANAAFETMNQFALEAEQAKQVWEDVAFEKIVSTSNYWQLKRLRKLAPPDGEAFQVACDIIDNEKLSKLATLSKKIFG